MLLCNDLNCSQFLLCNSVDVAVEGIRLKSFALLLYVFELKLLLRPVFSNLIFNAEGIWLNDIQKAVYKREKI